MNEGGVLELGRREINEDMNKACLPVADRQPLVIVIQLGVCYYDFEFEEGQ